MNFSSCLKSLTAFAAFGLLAIGTVAQAQDPHNPPTSANFTPVTSTLLGVQVDGTPGFVNHGLATTASYDLYVRSGATISFDQIAGDPTTAVTGVIDKIDGFYLIYNPRVGSLGVAGQGTGITPPASPGVTPAAAWLKSGQADGNIIGYYTPIVGNSAPGGLTPTPGVSSTGAFGWSAPLVAQNPGFPEFGFYIEAHSADPNVGNLNGFYAIPHFNTAGIPEPAYAQLAGLLMMGGVGTLFVRLRRKSAK